MIKSFPSTYNSMPGSEMGLYMESVLSTATHLIPFSAKMLLAISIKWGCNEEYTTVQDMWTKIVQNDYSVEDSDTGFSSEVSSSFGASALPFSDIVFSLDCAIFSF